MDQETLKKILDNYLLVTTQLVESNRYLLGRIQELEAAFNQEDSDEEESEGEESDAEEEEEETSDHCHRRGLINPSRLFQGRRFRSDIMANMIQGAKDKESQTGGCCGDVCMAPVVASKKKEPEE